MKKVGLISLILVLVCGLAGGAAYHYRHDIHLNYHLMFTDNDPLEVANDFWVAVLSNQPERAQEFQLEQLPKSADLIDGYNSSDMAILGESNQQEGIYFIETTVLLNRPQGSAALPLYTVVNSQDGQFKVDVHNTFGSVHDASLKRALNYYQSSVSSAATLLSSSQSEQERADLVNLLQLTLSEQLCDTGNSILRALSGDPELVYQGCAKPLTLAN